MKNFSLRKAAAVLLLLNAAGHVSAHASELRIPLKPNHIQVQPQTIGGTVSDARGPLPGVTVAVKGKTVLTTTDALGNFSIDAQPGEMLVFSFVGYKTAEITLGSNTSLKILLEEDVLSLQDVVVNAGYYSVKEKERTGSIARVTASEIDNQPVTEMLGALQGRVAGVNIIQTSGTPGGGFDIKIRGQNSLRAAGNNPLFIIDGVPISPDGIGSGINSPVMVRQPSPLSTINPEQIESIEILKDADATAIYGSRGANGVVLVTTKRGKAGKTRFTAKFASGLGSVAKFTKLLNTQEYVAMREEAYLNSGSAIPPSAYDINGTWDRTRRTDWQDKLLGGVAEFTNVDAAVSGGSNETQFVLTGNFNKQTGVYIKDFAYKKGGMRLNVNHESPNKKFKATMNVGYTAQKNDQPRLDLTRDAVRLAPNSPELYTDTGELNWENNTFNNPMRQLEGQYVSHTKDLVTGGLLSYEVLPGLQIRSNLGYTSISNDEYTASPSTIYSPATGLGPEWASVVASSSKRSSWIMEPQAQWVREFGKGRLDVLAGGTFQSQTGSQLVQTATGFPSNSLIYNLAAATTRTTQLDNIVEYRYQAFFGRVNYNWKGKYVLNLTGRRDGSSRFGPGKQFASFGATGFAWIFSKENLLKNSDLLSFGKLRASYGTTGSDQIGDYQFLDTYSSSGIGYDNVIGMGPSRLFNPNFAWERNRKFEVALETGFFNDRIFLTAGYFRNVSDNQLAGLPLPSTTGFSTIQANLDASVLNNGFEFTLRTENVKGRNFNWTTSFNLTVARNELLEFPDLESSPYATSYLIGQPLNIRKLYHLEGVDPQTGIYTFKDVNGDGQITALDDRKTIADLNPKFYGGLQNQFRYKDISLDFLFQFVKQENFGEESFFGMPGTESNQPVSVRDHWQQPGDVASHQMYATVGNTAASVAYGRYIESDAMIKDASFIRLKSLSLSYNVPAKWTKKVSLRFFFEAQNLLTITPYDGADPEFTVVGYLPPLRIWNTGIQFSF
ncbi:SusC/RagA family TonB-linked outer membrane protein [Flavobacterium selenitireducens]|uniref:SusC/RagA family TonB-linked outer membrane protein n=1 Tax=Flavobacterium selenitireducens TaxID=2722704 RepID=UPI00168A4C5E|nr:TonB-dependent receptor [Flavobacterium selenitireducens]MBD3581296.1 TonB-dependent receptor [Flavobacterium selenitireducens]